MLNKLFKALKRSRNGIVDSFQRLSEKKITNESLSLIEEQLLIADLGYETVESILSIIKLHSQSNYIQKVNEHLVSLLPNNYIPTVFKTPTIIMIVGVNGTGKTTTAAKLAKLYQDLQQTVTLIAADTYRAGAIKQLRIWGRAVGCNLICNENTTDPTAVLFDGIISSKAKESDVIIVDTAGRLHTYVNLMSELEKMYRMVNTKFSELSKLSLITMDASLGQNSIMQAKEFGNYIDLDGAILTKLDGTARGGIIFPLYQELGIPVKYIGIGEDLSDIYPFNPNTYVDGLLGRNESED